MREIKFKGLRVAGKGFIYGDLIHTNQQVLINQNIHESIKKQLDYDENVIPKTVGQFTGLQDKWGVDIYDGDVCRGPHDFGPAGFEDRTFTVFYDINLGYQWNYWDLKNIEVIGNIHESKI